MTDCTSIAIPGVLYSTRQDKTSAIYFSRMEFKARLWANMSILDRGCVCVCVCGGGGGGGESRSFQKGPNFLFRCVMVHSYSSD